MRCCETEQNSTRPAPSERKRVRSLTERQVHREMMTSGGNIAEDTLFGPERFQARAVAPMVRLWRNDWDQCDRGIHQGAQPPCCRSDAVYMAATDRTPESQRSPLAPRAPSIHGPRTMPSGLPMRTEITPGQTSDDLGFDLVMAENLPEPSVLLADRGYDADNIRKKMEARDVRTQIPIRKSRRMRVGVDHSLYSLHNLVERCFNKPKTLAASQPATIRSQRASLAS